MIATLNAYILYKKYYTKLRKKPVLHRVFRIEVVKSLVNETIPKYTDVTKRSKSNLAFTQSIFPPANDVNMVNLLNATT